jgi:hypothetical protein
MGKYDAYDDTAPVVIDPEAVTHEAGECPVDCPHCAADREQHRRDCEAAGPSDQGLPL